jgi:hypothetical protein
VCHLLYKGSKKTRLGEEIMTKLKEIFLFECRKANINKVEYVDGPITVDGIEAEGVCYPSLKWIKVPNIIGIKDLLTGLHEIGHVLFPEEDSELAIERFVTKKIEEYGLELDFEIKEQRKSRRLYLELVERKVKKL